MKNMKKILALVIAALLVMGMVSAFADTTYTITISKDSTDKAAHTYGAFQLFKGKLETKDGKQVLSDIQWGDDIDSTKIDALITELDAIDGVTIADDKHTASDIARAISDANMGSDSVKAQAVADAFAKAIDSTASKTGTIAADETSGTITGLAAGYYFVKDINAVSGMGAETRFILEVVGNVSVTEKASVPTVEKKVKEKNDSTGSETGWQDAADYDIGDSIPYMITGTLPSKFMEFDTYKTYTFTDTLSAGLTPPTADSITINLNTEDGTNIKSLFDVVVNGQIITISLKNGVDLRAVKVSEDPDAELMFSASSQIIVKYNATLNSSAKLGAAGNPNEVGLEFSNNPNYDGDGDTGTTPKDKVTVFTYKLVTNKIGEDAYPLEGAGFTLYKWDSSQSGDDKYVQVGSEITGVTTFEFTGEDAGQYKLVETTVPTGYNKCDDLVFKVVATYAATRAGQEPPELTGLVVTDLNGNTITTWVIDSVDYSGATSQYAQAETDIENRQGSTLPSTGGIGTTLFYIGGGILVLAAVILLVTKRRMNAND